MNSDTDQLDTEQLDTEQLDTQPISHNRRSRRNRWAVAALLFGAVAIVPNLADADGGQVPGSAPWVNVGVPTFGNTDSPDSGPHQDYYRLPGLLAQSRVTVAAKTTSSNSQIMCLAGNVDNFNWSQERCNLSRHIYFGKSGNRMEFQAEYSTNNAYLRVRDSTGGAYQFTIEKIQHAVGLSMPQGPTLKTNGAISVHARMVDGRPVGNNVPVIVLVEVNGVRYGYTAYTRNGFATARVSLPPSADGKPATVTAYSKETHNFLPVSSTPKAMNVVK